MADLSIIGGPVLAAEDEETDAMLLRWAFQKAGIPNELIVARDGEEAVDYLNRDVATGIREQHRRPCLLLLDLKMPRMDGFEVLAWLAGRPQFRELPVVVLSSSTHESDMERARQLGACDYKVKPHSMENYVEMLQELQARWINAAVPVK